ncbi:unnamed protein product [Pleuronectes platessa]|uniref:Uncharacterized protein n=1 Tax=Pleuronectes platessa TaxID=8262 RepID=A0A9N7YBY1_PLEPL|nr:unnamed protein product [Pleuronectes platessa]
MTHDTRSFSFQLLLPLLHPYHIEIRVHCGRIMEYDIGSRIRGGNGGSSMADSISCGLIVVIVHRSRGSAPCPRSLAQRDTDHSVTFRVGQARNEIHSYVRLGAIRDGQGTQQPSSRLMRRLASGAYRTGGDKLLASSLFAKATVVGHLVRLGPLDHSFNLPTRCSHHTGGWQYGAPNESKTGGAN